MVILELQYFEIMDKDFTAVEARIFIGGICARIFRNFDASDSQKERYSNQSERFELPDQYAAVAFIRSNHGYSEIETKPFPQSGL